MTDSEAKDRPSECEKLVRASEVGWNLDQFGPRGLHPKFNKG